MSGSILYSSRPFSASAAAVPAEPGTVKLVFPENVTLTVHKSFDAAGETARPAVGAAQNGLRILSFSDLTEGNYCFLAEGDGTYQVKKNFALTAEEIRSGIVLYADPGKPGPGDFQPTGVIHQFTDAVYEKVIPADPSLWPEYEKIFVTPVFTGKGRPIHQQTTHEEMLAFIRGLENKNGCRYLYFAGKSPVYGFDMPVVLFTRTDLSSASTLEEAAALVAADGKPTVHYQAGIHANEPAGGEGAMAMIAALSGEYGERLLDRMNIYVIPRVNADGAKLYQRANAAAGIDMNRDHLLVSSAEVELAHAVYHLFRPIVTIDGHEFNASKKTLWETGPLDDVLVGASGTFNTGSTLNEIGQRMVHAVFDRAAEMGLRPYNYPTYSTTVNNAIGRAYYGLCGSVSFLVETLGIGIGLTAFPRRVVCQYLACETLLNYTAAHLDEITQAVAAERARLVRLGAVYDENSLLVLKHTPSKSEETGYTLPRPKWDHANGEKTQCEATYYRYDTAERTRPRPTAYVLPKGEPWEEKALSVLKKNFLFFYEAGSGTRMMLRQYSGTRSSAELLPETETAFPQGAYVLPMNQENANVLAMTLEPDVSDSEKHNGTLVQSGIVQPAEGGLLPIYRSERNLTSDGKAQTVYAPSEE